MVFGVNPKGTSSVLNDPIGFAESAKKTGRCFSSESSLFMKIDESLERC